MPLRASPPAPCNITANGAFSVDDPVVFTVKDPASYAVGALVLLLLAVATV